MEQADTGHAKADQVRMARDVAMILKAMADHHTELHAVRTRLEAELERVRDELDRARQDAGLWREEADRERARIANMQADAEHTEREMARLQAELDQVRGIGKGTAAMVGRAVTSPST